MSSLMQVEAAAGIDSTASAVEAVIVPRARDLGGFEVRRALPAAGRQMVGPFIFLDQMGPAALAAGEGMDVRPHPHIGLATLTYLMDGEIMHRDSLGTIQPIRPGEVNLMTAGRGIAHSERSPQAERAVGPRLFGLQLWLALPATQEEMEPGFEHRGVADLPMIEGEGKNGRLVAGAAYGQRSPVGTQSETLFVDLQLESGASLPVDAAVEERALYLISGDVEIGGVTHPAGRLLVLRPGDAVTVRAASPARFVLLGGAAMDGPRHIWWNFVSSRKDRIEAAKADWAAGRFEVVPGESEFIPLP